MKKKGANSDTANVSIGPTSRRWNHNRTIHQRWIYHRLRTLRTLTVQIPVSVHLLLQLMVRAPPLLSLIQRQSQGCKVLKTICPQMIIDHQKPAPNHFVCSLLQSHLRISAVCHPPHLRLAYGKNSRLMYEGHLHAIVFRVSPRKRMSSMFGDADKYVMTKITNLG